MTAVHELCLGIVVEMCDRVCAHAGGGGGRNAVEFAAKRRSCGGLKGGVVSNLAAYRKQAQVLRVLANGSRLMIVDRLSHGEASTNELVGLLGLNQSTVSRHLGILRANGIVDDRRERGIVVYRLVMPCVNELIVNAVRVLTELDAAAATSIRPGDSVDGLGGMR